MAPAETSQHDVLIAGLIERSHFVIPKALIHTHFSQISWHSELDFLCGLLEGQHAYQ